MDRTNGDQTKATFGPEWLKESPTAHFSLTEDDLSRQGNNGIKGAPRAYHTPLKKIPLRFTRSKSTPLLPVEEGGEQVQQTEKKQEDVFTMLKERNSFDRNFPTLNTVKPKVNVLSQANNGVQNGMKSLETSAAVNNSTTKSDSVIGGSAWKSSQSKPIPLNGTTNYSNGASTSPGAHSVTETEIQLASCIVPTVQAPKILVKNKVELLTKKGPAKKKIDTSGLLRKASSEPNLPIPAAYQENYAKLMAAKKLAAASIPDKDKHAKVVEKPKSGTVVLNRSDFFKGVMKKETGLISQDENIRQHRRVVSDGQSELLSYQPSISSSMVTPGDDQPSSQFVERNPSGSSNSSIEGEKESNGNNRESPEVNSHNASSRSNSPKISPEDEEKFLRDLGWVPDEEDHVPELTEEEILEEAKKLKNWKTQINSQKKRLSLDVSTIKKWQNDRERLFATKIY